MKRVIFSFVVVAAIAILAVVVTSCGNAQAQGGGSAQSVRWEYKSVELGYGGDKAENILNGLGAEGWELVTTTMSMNSPAYGYLKRRLP